MCRYLQGIFVYNSTRKKDGDNTRGYDVLLPIFFDGRYEYNISLYLNSFEIPTNRMNNLNLCAHNILIYNQYIIII